MSRSALLPGFTVAPEPEFDPGQLLCTAALCSALGPALRLGYIVNIWDAPAELFGVLRLVAAWGLASDLCWLLRGPP